MEEKFMKNKIYHLVFCLTVMIILFGCQSLNLNNMYPNLDKLSIKQSNKKLKVTKIKNSRNKLKGSQNSFFLKDIDEVSLEKILVHSLEKSKMFYQLVSDDTTYDFRLDSEIISQGQKLRKKDISVISTLIMKYRLIDVKSGKTIWDEKITSSGKATFSDAFNGSTRANLSLERAISKNLTKLIKKLSKTDQLYI